MWIKQTKVKSKNTEYVYYQLMKTVYLDGKSHQLVVANLGRKGEVEEALVYRLAEAITDEPYLFLPDDLLALLPTKRLGETFLLNKAFEITSLRRFLEDLAEFKCLGANSVSALLFLLSYYSFHQGLPLIRDFFKKYYIRIEGDLKTTSYADAFRLLRGTPQVHPGIISNYNKLKNSHQLKCHYLFDVQADPSLVDGGSLCVDVMTDEYPIRPALCPSPRKLCTSISPSIPVSPLHHHPPATFPALPLNSSPLWQMLTPNFSTHCKRVTIAGDMETLSTPPLTAVNTASSPSSHTLRAVPPSRHASF